MRCSLILTMILSLAHAHMRGHPDPFIRLLGNTRDSRFAGHDGYDNLLGLSASAIEDCPFKNTSQYRRGFYLSTLATLLLARTPDLSCPYTYQDLHLLSLSCPNSQYDMFGMLALPDICDDDRVFSKVPELCAHIAPETYERPGQVPVQELTTPGGDDYEKMQKEAARILDKQASVLQKASYEILKDMMSLPYRPAVFTRNSDGSPGGQELENKVPLMFECGAMLTVTGRVRFLFKTALSQMENPLAIHTKLHIAQRPHDFDSRATVMDAVHERESLWNQIQHKQGAELQVPEVVRDVLPDAQWTVEADWKTLSILNDTEREWATSHGSVFSSTSGLFTVPKSFEFPHIHLEELLKHPEAMKVAKDFFGFNIYNYIENGTVEVDAAFENPMTMGQYCNYNTPGRLEYIQNFVMNRRLGGGIFVEYHAFPHVLTPMQVDSFLTQTVGKHLGGDKFAFLNIMVPYGYVLTLNPNTIHCDSGNSGVALSAFSNEPADVVFLRTLDDNGRPLVTFNPYSQLINREPMTEMQRALHDVQHVMKFVRKLDNTVSFIRKFKIDDEIVV